MWVSPRGGADWGFGPAPGRTHRTRDDTLGRPSGQLTGDGRGRDEIAASRRPRMVPRMTVEGPSGHLSGSREAHVDRGWIVNAAPADTAAFGAMTPQIGTHQETGPSRYPVDFGFV